MAGLCISGTGNVIRGPLPFGDMKSKNEIGGLSNAQTVDNSSALPPVSRKSFNANSGVNMALKRRQIAALRSKYLDERSTDRGYNSLDA